MKKRNVAVMLVVILVGSLLITPVFASSFGSNDQIQCSCSGNSMNLFIPTLISSIAATLTAIAALSAPVIVAKIENNRVIQTQKNELVYSKKVEAYKRVADSFGSCRLNPTKEDTDNMFSAISYAAMFSSQETADSMVSLSGSLLSENCNLSDLSRIYQRTCTLMQKELDLDKVIRKGKNV